MSLTTATVTILDPPSLSNITFFAPYFHSVSSEDMFPVTSKVVAIQPFHFCGYDTIKNAESLTGSIVLVDTRGNSDADQKDYSKEINRVEVDDL
jgi:hypothetical protein